MRITPLHEIADRSFDIERVAVVYPFNSPRATRAGDPSVHDLSSAIDLFLLATRVLSSRYGDPDFPSVDPTPESWRGDALSVVVWDFDYYQLVLEVRLAADSDGRGYTVCVRRSEP